jgi:hypothetical protein
LLLSNVCNFFFVVIAFKRNRFCLLKTKRSAAVVAVVVVVVVFVVVASNLNCCSVFHITCLQHQALKSLKPQTKIFSLNILMN